MANFGYTSAVYVFEVETANGKKGYFVAGSMGEAVDQYAAGQLAGYNAIDQEFPAITVRIVSPTLTITSSSIAGASSGIALTAQQWATTYAAIAAVGASGTNSSTGAQGILVRSS